MRDGSQILIIAEAETIAGCRLMQVLSSQSRGQQRQIAEVATYTEERDRERPYTDPA